jgi:hypothetical protein
VWTDIYFVNSRFIHVILIILVVHILNLISTLKISFLLVRPCSKFVPNMVSSISTISFAQRSGAASLVYTKLRPFQQRLLQRELWWGRPLRQPAGLDLLQHLCVRLQLWLRVVGEGGRCC